jgi:hypothetical protein
MEKVGKFVVKHRIAIIIIVVLLTAFFGWKALELKFDDDITKYPPQTDPLVSHYEDLSSEFNIRSLIMIAMDIKNTDDLKIVDEITEDLAADEDIKSVSSLSNVPIVNVSDYGLEVITLSNGIKNGTVDTVNVLEHDSIVGKFISNDGKSALITFSIKEGLNEKEIYSAIKNNLDNKYNKTFHYYGISPVNSAVETIAMRNLSKLIPIAILIIFFILLMSFRSFLGAFLPLLNVIISVIWTMGIVSLLNIPLTVANSVIPVVLISIGTAYSIHIINKYMEESGTNEEKIINTEKEVGVAVILSGLTTAVGFLSLLTADINPVCTLGIFSALGVILANLLALTFVPSVLQKIKTRKSAAEETKLRIPEKLFNPYLVIILFVGIVSLMLPLALNLRTDMDIVNSINPDETIIKDCEYIGDKFGGNGTIFIDVKGDFRSPGLMQTMYGMEQEIIKIDGVNETYSIVDVMEKLSESFCGFECVPSSAEELDNLWFFMENNDAIYQLVNRNFNRGIIQVSYDVGSKEENEIIINDIQKILDKNPGKFGLVEVNEETASEISDYYSKFIDLTSQDYENNLIKALNTPAGELFSANEDELKTVISQADEFGDYQLTEEEKLEILKRMMNMKEYSYDILTSDLEGINEYYEDLSYDIDSLLFVRLREWKTKNFSELLGINDSEETVMALLPAAQENVYIPGNDTSVEMSQIGTDQILLHIQDMLFNDLYESMLMTIVIVFLLFLIEFRSLKIALLGIVPSILTVVLNFEIMGILGISLNTATISIAAIAIGAGIDYAIHFVNRFKIEYSRSNESLPAVRRTLITSGKGVIYNALSVAFGFFALIFSDIGIIREFGVLTGISMLVAAFTSLLFLAAAFSLLKNPLKRKQGK